MNQLLFIIWINTTTPLTEHNMWTWLKWKLMLFMKTFILFQRYSITTNMPHSNITYVFRFLNACFIVSKLKTWCFGSFFFHQRTIRNQFLCCCPFFSFKILLHRFCGKISTFSKGLFYDSPFNPLNCVTNLLFLSTFLVFFQCQWWFDGRLWSCWKDKNS